MALELTNNTKRALSDLSIEPIIAVKIEGIETVFSSGATKEYIKIGDPNLFIDGSWVIGGFRELINNRQLIDSGTTSYSIRQQMNYDEGQGSSISNMTIGLVDQNGFVSELITPEGEFDVLGRKAKVYLGFGTTSFNDDFFLIFQGYVSDIDSNAGLISLKINHPDNKKKVSLFKQFTTKLTAAIAGNTVLTASVEDTSGLLNAVSGSLESYITINKELIKVTVTGPTTLSLVRGQLGTIATAHDSGDECSSVYALIGNPLDIALKIMLSGSTDPAFENIPIEQFVKNGLGSGLVYNGIFLKEINTERDYNIQVGDIVTVSGANSGGNNFTNRTVTAITSDLRGTTIQVDGTALNYELNSPAVLSFKSKYNVLPNGMNLKPDDVDILQHEFIKDFFHPSTEYRLLVDDDVDDGKEFLDKDVYQPIACYSLPRKARSSVGYSIGPIPGSDIKTLNITNIKNPEQLKITRTTSRAFFNEVIYKYDKSPVSDKFLKGYAIVSQDSKNRIFGSSRAFKVEAKGLRSELNGDNVAQSESQRIIDRYKFAAESVYVSSLLKNSVDIEIGDVVVLDGSGLSITDITQGNRQFQPRLFEVRNKDINLKTGEVSFELLDTGQDIDTRYGLMSPVSKIASVVSQSQFIITFMDNYPSRFGLSEFRNWESIYNIQDGIPIIIRNSAYTVSESAIISNINENVFTLSTPASLTLSEGLVIEFNGYNESSAQEKLVYAYMTDSATFDDGLEPYSMI
jgi:hypothetical protein